MGNTIKQQRRRPRKRSVNFRAFWWLVFREAYFSITSASPWLPDQRSRRQAISMMRPDNMRRWVRYLLHLDPSRRYYP